MSSTHAKEPAMTVHPKNQKDLMLAPVAVEIDRNLQRLRVDSPYDVLAELELELDRPAMCEGPEERAELVLRQALRDVDLHGWTATLTDDASRIHLEGGSVSLDLGLSPVITSYITEGASVTQA
jgi:hypothetical protein